MNQKQKDLARKSLEVSTKKTLKPSKFKSEFISTELNDKGNYYYAVIGIDLEIKTDTGIITLNKDIQIPISLKDVDIIEPKPKVSIDNTKKPETKSKSGLLVGK